jgi:hypothetical protein
MLLVKVPVPDPSVVWLSEMVGFAEVLQQTPLWVIEAPPSLIPVPPELAVVEVMLEAAVVVTVGASRVVNDRSSP